MMNSRRLWATVALCLLVCLVMAFFVEQAQAAETTKGDKDLAKKRGISDSLANTKGKTEDDRMPSKFQMGIGIGSIFVAFIVVKFF